MDQQIQDLLERVQQAGRKPFSQCTPQEARAFPTMMKSLFGSAPAGTRNRDLTIPSSDGFAVPARLYKPAGGAAGLIVFFHGGGWVLGSVDDYDPFTATLAAESGFAVLSVDYRLAPEHPYPTPVHDARAALTFAAEHGSRLLGEPLQKLVAMGDSAGATLATVATRHHRGDPGKRAVDLQVLVYPVAAAGFDTQSYRDYRKGFLLGEQDMRWFWDQYCPRNELRTHADASPSAAADLAGLGKVLVLTAECDPLRDEGEQYGRLLAAAGNACEVVRCEGLVHGFLAMINFAPSARSAFEKITAAIRNA
ncbi:alpha/beta hydrolase [Ramlibacter sp. 2FC]|uniref:alpha/beta hydrolase n=1 Tax=Ramlibacter sp. 2FC TaxID=2502188 RepID=UPI0010F58D2E|nr:alpha/beta hydrolase [Ramlibacter sp. 2FC]